MRPGSRMVHLYYLGHGASSRSLRRLEQVKQKGLIESPLPTPAGLFLTCPPRGDTSRTRRARAPRKDRALTLRSRASSSCDLFLRSPPFGTPFSSNHARTPSPFLPLFGTAMVAPARWKITRSSSNASRRSNRARLVGTAAVAGAAVGAAVFVAERRSRLNASSR